MLISVVIPVYNEAESLPALLSTLEQVLVDMGCQRELLFVDDGSSDDSNRILREAATSDPSIKVLEFSRNFGHQTAITAGLDFASGDAVVVMDADMQDPPELLPQMLDLMNQGYDVVSAQRLTRQGESFLKRKTASVFYWIMRNSVDKRLRPEVGDFRMFSSAALTAIRSFREQHRFMRGLVAWLGLREAILPFHRRARGAGVTKYSVSKMIRFAWTAISSFSALPLRLSLPLGAMLTCVGILYSAYSIYLTVVKKVTVPGWTSLVCLQTLFSGATLMAVGLLGDYVARIYEEAKHRPLYVVARTMNLQDANATVARAVILPPRGSSELARVAPRGRVAGR